MREASRGAPRLRALGSSGPEPEFVVAEFDDDAMAEAAARDALARRRDARRSPGVERFKGAGTGTQEVTTLEVRFLVTLPLPSRAPTAIRP